jgi:radical SAM superfamily enzyme YgiQ (UPF0313 family)
MTPINSLFISSPYPGELKFGGQPTGLLYALTILSERKSKNQTHQQIRNNIKVICPSGIPDLDNSVFKDELISLIRTFKPKIVGVSTFTVAYENALKIMAIVKNISKDTVVIFGGGHEDNFVKYYKQQGFVDADFVIAGDGMYILDWLYDFIEKRSNLTVNQIKHEVIAKNNELGLLSGVGLLLFNYSNKLLFYDTQRYIQDKLKRKPIRFDQLPLLPRYLLLDEDKLSSQYFIFDNKKTAQIMVGQGCPFSCAFCSEGIKKVYYDDFVSGSVNMIRDIKHVEKELKELKKNKYSAIFFDDSTFLAKPKDYVVSLIKLIHKYKFDWDCQTTQSSIHYFKEELNFFKQHGCKYIYIGLEHFDSNLRDSFGKSIGLGSKFMNYNFDETMELLKAADIAVGISLTFGHPNPFDEQETTQESEATVKFAIDKTAEDMKKYSNIIGISINIITYHPGTLISQRYEEKVGKLDFTKHPNNFYPFTSFEEGLGPHAPGMTKALAEFILKYSKKSFGSKLWN